MIGPKSELRGGNLHADIRAATKAAWVLRACCRERRQLQRMSHSYYLAGLLFDGRELRHNPTLRVYLTNVVAVLLIKLATPLGFVIADPRGWQRFSEWIAR